MRIKLLSWRMSFSNLVLLTTLDSSKKAAEFFFQTVLGSTTFDFWMLTFEKCFMSVHCVPFMAIRNMMQN